jgi:hypothetical protein
MGDQEDQDEYLPEVLPAEMPVALDLPTCRPRTTAV